MADFQNQNQNWSGQGPSLGMGEGEVPLAKPPIMDMTMRTMSSDISSMKDSGGGEPRAYVPREPIAPQAPMPQANAPRPMGMPTFQPAASIPPQVDMGAVTPLSVPQASKPKSGNALFLTITFILVAIGIGAIGWFFIYPQINVPASTPTPITEEQPAVATSTGQDIDQPAVIPSETASTTPDAFGTSAPTNPPTTPPVQEPVPPTPPPAVNVLPTVDTHVSLFKTPADFSSEATVGAVTLDTVKGALQSSPVEVPVLKEVVFKNEAGKAYAFSAIAPLFMPSVFTPEVSALFAPDASYFTYTTNVGTWPGIVLTLAPTADLAKAKSDIAKIELNNEYLSLFMVEAGTPTTWKDGKVGTNPGRYISLSQQGASFNYVWVGRTLVIGTNYAGIQEAVKRLGL